MIQKIPSHITSSCIDGLIQGVLWCVFEQYCISIFAADSIVADAVIIFVLLILSFLSGKKLLPQNGRKNMLKGFSLSMICFALIILFDLISQIDGNTLFPMLLPRRQLGNADGFIIILYMAILGSAIILMRIVLVVVYFVKTRISKN